MPKRSTSDGMRAARPLGTPIFDSCFRTLAEPQMMSLKKVVGASQIIIGTDYPFNNAARHLAGLQKVGFTPEELRGIHRENVLRVVPQYKT